MILSIIFTLVVVLFGFSSYMLLRNNLVYELRMRSLNEVHRYATEAIEQNMDWECFHAVIDGVSYSTMMMTFWKPLRAYKKELLERLERINNDQKKDVREMVER